MRLVPVILLLSSIAALDGAQAQPQQRALSWDEVAREGVLRAHLWTVSLLRLPDGALTCEAASLGRDNGADYAIRIRAAQPNPLLIVSRAGPPFPSVHDVTLTLDGTALASLPIRSRQSFGADPAVTVELKEPEFGRMLARMNAGRMLTAQVGQQTFSVPVIGFDDVTAAIGECNEQREAQSRQPKP